jgi:hypothetical protein
VVQFLVDSNSQIRPGDSLRLSAEPTGALSDTVANAPGKLAWWTPILWGQPPAILTLTVPHPVVQLGNIRVPPNEPAVTVMIHPDLVHQSTWTPVPGSQARPDTTRLGGVIVRLNRLPENLGIYVYDNLGVLVLRQDLPKLTDLEAAGILQRDRRGNYEVWLGWNGKDSQGRDAASGVYLIRIFGWLRDGTRLYFLNEIKTTGINRTMPNSMIYLQR